MTRPQPPHMRIEDETIVDRTVDLDFHQFYRCSFRGCVLRYSGQGPVGLDSCSFDEHTRWVLDGPAATTIEFLRHIRTQGPGGSQVVQAVIQRMLSLGMPGEA